jgi:VWFA-related protein
MFTPRDYPDKKGEVKFVRQLPAVAVCILLMSVLAESQVKKTVSLYVTVEKGDGLVQGLTSQNFRLSEDGKSQPFELEKPESPISIALLMEYSQSSWVYFDDINAVIQGFLDQAAEGNWYALATYAHQLEIQADFTKQIGRIRQAYQELPEPMWNETDTYDAVYEMLDKMSRLPGRSVLIVIASGYDSFSQHTFEEVQKEVESSNVTLFSVGLGSMYRGVYDPYLSDAGRMDLLLAENFLRMLADESGGDSWFPNEVGAYADVMKGIMQTLANQYRLVYSPQVISNGKLHKIEVEAFQVANDRRQDFKVRVRKGWRF